VSDTFFGGGELIHIPLEYPDFKFKWNGIFAIIPFHLFDGIFTMTVFNNQIIVYVKSIPTRYRK
jgi:hypothetical protein